MRRGSPAVDGGPLTGCENPAALLSITKIVLPFWAFMFAQFSKSLELLDERETRSDGREVDSEEFKEIEELKTRKGALR